MRKIRGKKLRYVKDGLSKLVEAGYDEEFAGLVGLIAINEEGAFEQFIDHLAKVETDKQAAFAKLLSDAQAKVGDAK